MVKNVRKTVIFDLDGTLLNTLDDLSASVNHALRLNGFPERTLLEIRSFLGNGIRSLMLCSVPKETPSDCFEKVFSDFRSYYLEHCLEATAPYPGVLALMAQLRELGVEMAIVSNKLQPAVEELTQRFFKDYVSVAIGESLDVQRKPAPDMVLLALRRLGVTQRDAVYIGDSEVDMLTAKNAELPCISVLWGFRDRDFLEHHGANHLAEIPEQVLSLLQQPL